MTSVGHGESQAASGRAIASRRLVAVCALLCIISFVAGAFISEQRASGRVRDAIEERDIYRSEVDEMSRELGDRRTGLSRILDSPHFVAAADWPGDPHTEYTKANGANPCFECHRESECSACHIEGE